MMKIDWQSEYVEAVALGLTMDTNFPLKIESANSNALIDTGTLDSCTSENVYNQPTLPTMKQIFHLSVNPV